jgi:TonB family protein
VGGGSNSGGSGSGRKGVGLGAPSDVGSGIAPVTNGGSGANAGAVISSEPGSKVGMPTSGGTGSLAMSPAGGEKTGFGGAGGGSGIGRGEGPGSAINGAGSGAAKTGAGHGSDPSAQNGISPSAGPGGAGSLPSGTPAVRGVDISGGSSIITLPGFGSDPAGNDPSNSTAARAPVKGKSQLNVTVVATANSGGAFEPYKKLLKGEQYTTYVDTTIGTVVMQFADENTASHAFGGTLAAPSAVRSDLPDGLPHARMVITCTLDASGNIKNVRVLEAGPATMTAKVVAALRAWKFQPATRGGQPVEVTAILGFGINTDDRF